MPGVRQCFARVRERPGGAADGSRGSAQRHPRLPSPSPAPRQGRRKSLAQNKGAHPAGAAAWRAGGTTHGTPYEYDTHVPLLIAGPGIHPGEYARFVDMADLAPTLAALLAIEPPAGSEGRVIPEVTGAATPPLPAPAAP